MRAASAPTARRPRGGWSRPEPPGQRIGSGPMAVPPPRRRARRGSLERPVSGRIYRAAWVAAAVPLLVAAFSLGRPVPLQEPRLPPPFDRTTAVQFTKEFVRLSPDRRPGSSGAEKATNWVAARLQ